MDRTEWEKLFHVPGKKSLKILKQRRDSIGYDKLLGAFFQSQQLWDIYYRMQGENIEQKDI